VSHCFPVPPDTGRGHQLPGITARQGLLLDFDPRCRLSARYLARVPRSCVPSVEAIAIRWQKFAVLSPSPRGRVNARPVLPADRLPPESPASSNFRCAHATARQRSSVSHTRQVDHRRRRAASCTAEAAVEVGVNILLKGYPGCLGQPLAQPGVGGCCSAVWVRGRESGTVATVRSASVARNPPAHRVRGGFRCASRTRSVADRRRGNTRPVRLPAATGVCEQAEIAGECRAIRGAGFSPCTRGRKLNRKPWPG
jgi:hypothetical protein